MPLDAYLDASLDTSLDASVIREVLVDHVMMCNVLGGQMLSDDLIRRLPNKITGINVILFSIFIVRRASFFYTQLTPYTVTSQYAYQLALVRSATQLPFTVAAFRLAGVAYSRSSRLLIWTERAPVASERANGSQKQAGMSCGSGAMPYEADWRGARRLWASRFRLSVIPKRCRLSWSANTEPRAFRYQSIYTRSGPL